MEIKKIPVTIPYFTEEETQEVAKVLDSGWVAQGPVVARFEETIAEHEGICHGIATTSCTTALHLAMVAKGLTRGMDAIVPAFTFVATANAVAETGATPVFVDVCQETFNVDIAGLEQRIEADYQERNGQLINRKTGNVLWGIVPVHEFGLCCDILSVNRIAERYGLCVVEDAACALGAKIGERHQGSFGNISCVSFHPRKSITTGEGGMILTDDAGLARRMRELRTHGSSVSADSRHAGKGFLLPEFREAGYNYRMTDIQAAVGLAQSKKLDFIISEKGKKAKQYDRWIKEQIPELRVPFIPQGYFHTYQSYVCMLDYGKLGLKSVEEGGAYRNALLQRLEDQGIATRQGTHAVPMLGCYQSQYGYRPEDFPNAWACDRLSITLPLFVQMSDEEQQLVVSSIRRELDNMR